jgi:hypothetical protein
MLQHDAPCLVLKLGQLLDGLGLGRLGHLLAIETYAVDLVATFCAMVSIICRNIA